jgi:hypothetical protein
MKKVLFDAHTPFQLMVAVSIAYVYYPNDCTTLVLGNALFTNPLDLKKRIQSSNIFDRVELTNEIQTKQNIVAEVNSFELEKTDIYHFSSYSTISSCYIYNILVDKAKIILNEEGGATYDLFKKYQEFKLLFPSESRDDIDLTKLSEIWVFNKLLYDSEFKERIKEIHLECMDDEIFFIRKLNDIFDYKFSEIKEKNIFFTQNFIDYGVVSYAEVEDFFNSLVKVFKNDIVLKLHPFDKSTAMYEKLNIKYLQNMEQVPWELVLLNHLAEKKLQPKTFLTIGSSSFCSFSLFLKYKALDTNNHQYRLMTRLLDTPFNKSFEEYYERLNRYTGFEYDLVKSFDSLSSK